MTNLYYKTAVQITQHTYNQQHTHTHTHTWDIVQGWISVFLKIITSRSQTVDGKATDIKGQIRDSFLSTFQVFVIVHDMWPLHKTFTSWKHIVQLGITSAWKLVDLTGQHLEALGDLTWWGEGGHDLWLVLLSPRSSGIYSVSTTGCCTRWTNHTHWWFRREPISRRGPRSDSWLVDRNGSELTVGGWEGLIILLNEVIWWCGGDWWCSCGRRLHTKWRWVSRRSVSGRRLALVPLPGPDWMRACATTSISVQYLVLSVIHIHCDRCNLSELGMCSRLHWVSLILAKVPMWMRIERTTAVYSSHVSCICRWCLCLKNGIVVFTLRLAVREISWWWRVEPYVTGYLEGYNNKCQKQKSEHASC